MRNCPTHLSSFRQHNVPLSRESIGESSPVSGPLCPDIPESIDETSPLSREPIGGAESLWRSISKCPGRTLTSWQTVKTGISEKAADRTLVVDKDVLVAG
jgi:hypothetical protein